MHVISASRRTDIPAFYSEWFMDQVRAGRCSVLHPFRGEVLPVSLLPEDVIAFVFWTRNPHPLIPHLPELERRGFRSAFLVTVTGYDRTFEPSAPDLVTAVEGIRRLARRGGAEFVQWRYDPIVLTSRWDAAWHAQHFERLCQALQGYTHRCLFSFLQLYRKNRERLDQVAAAGRFTYGYVPSAKGSPPRFGRELSLQERKELAGELGRIAAAYGIRLQSCCDDLLVDPLANVGKARCVDPEVIEALRPDLFRQAQYRQAIVELRGTRAGCGCLASVDIGTYDTCRYGCVYCYATRERPSRCVPATSAENSVGVR